MFDSLHQCDRQSDRLFIVSRHWQSRPEKTLLFVLHKPIVYSMEARDSRNLPETFSVMSNMRNFIAHKHACGETTAVALYIL